MRPGGWRHRDETKRKISRSLTGHDVTDITRARLSASQTGRVVASSTRNKLRARFQGEGSHFAKLTEDEVIAIRKFIKYGMTLAEIAERYNVSSDCISSIKRGRTWRHLLERRCISFRDIRDRRHDRNSAGRLAAVLSRFIQCSQNATTCGS
jgi:predicted DNA-binding protein YlxM (UPF0122 family)